MPPYCISSVLNRRDFLKLLLILAGCTVVLNSPGQAKSFEKSAWQAPIWLWDLASGKIKGPDPSIPMPYGMPGSVMKLVTATALLEDGVISSNQHFTCGGQITLHGRRSVCPHAHDSLTLIEALGLSCNVFFAQAVEKLSPHRWLHYAQLFQLDQPLHASEAFQFVTDNLHSQSIQQLALGLSSSIQPNALQLLRVAKIIAQREIPAISPGTWEVLQGGMRLAARRGTAQALDPPDQYHLAAKTGTAPHGQRFDSWLIGYFPFEKPRYAFCARASAGTAKESAVPLMHRFLSQRGPF